jgi:hypothetical protein
MKSKVSRCDSEERDEDSNCIATANDGAVPLASDRSYLTRRGGAPCKPLISKTNRSKLARHSFSSPILYIVY